MTILSTWADLGWDKNTPLTQVPEKARLAKFDEVVKNIANKIGVVHNDDRLRKYELKSFEENTVVVEFADLQNATEQELTRLVDSVMSLGGKWFLVKVVRGDTEIAIR